MAAQEYSREKRTCDIPNLEGYVPLPDFPQVERDSGHNILAPLELCSSNQTWRPKARNSNEGSPAPIPVHSRTKSCRTPETVACFRTARLVDESYSQADLKSYYSDLSVLGEEEPVLDECSFADLGAQACSRTH